MKGADAQQLASYRCGEAVVHVVIVSYVNQGQGKELIGTDNAVVPREWWELGAQTRQDLALRDGGTLRVNQTRMAHAAGSMIAWHWFAVNGRATPSGPVAKLYEALAALAFRPIESRAYVVSVEGPAAAEQALQAHAQATLDSLDAWRGR
jgi:EpsI family protein